jgi:uncharacterized protein (DUF736 family)
MKRRTSGPIGSPASGEKTPAADYKVQDGGPCVGARWSRLKLVGGAGKTVVLHRPGKNKGKTKVWG